MPPKSKNERLAGVLLHPVSLPGPHGIGDVGTAAERFLAWMQRAGLRAWQVLPLGPTSFGDSPYQCFSAFGGNPLLVSPELLVEDGLLAPSKVHSVEGGPGRVDYGAVIHEKNLMLREAHGNFEKSGDADLRRAFDSWRGDPGTAGWLEDFALFMALKDAHGGAAWGEWPEPPRTREVAALKKARRELADSIRYHSFAQFLFHRQWSRLREKATAAGITLVGDAPIYVALDSADAWANQGLFQFDAEGKPTAVAGVPPDYFSKTGQFWGNPLYDWKAMETQGFAWWKARVCALLKMVDVVRLDHFRGFVAYWSIPAGDATAENGKWVKAPGGKFFDALKKEFGTLPLIAEDLGDISEDVHALRRKLGLPGMKVLQFAWTPRSTDPLVPDESTGFLPHQCEENSVVYTGTHDNNTTAAWWHEELGDSARHLLRTYLSTDGKQPHWDLIRAAYRALSRMAIVPMQDFLGLGSEARMNTPGLGEGNWSWRLREEQLDGALADHLRRLGLLYGRVPYEGRDPEEPQS